MLCITGDLGEVLNDEHVPQDAMDGLYKVQCVDRSRDRVDTIYASLTWELQESLKSAFWKHGYEINAKPAANFHIYPSYDNINFYPPGQQY